MRRLVDADKLMDGLGRLATDTDLCKRYGNCTPWIPYSAVRKLISDMILEAKESCDDAVNRQEAIGKIKKRLFETAFNNVGIKQNIDETLVDVAENRLENWFDELPSIQPYTTTHDSIPAETGGNDEDRTSGDCISRTQAIMAIEQHRIAVLEGHKWDEGIEYGYAAAHRHLVDIIENLPFAQPETNCSEIPNNSDTISKQAVTKFLNDWLSCLFENCHKQSASDLKMIIKDFKNLPSVQPERKDAVEKAVAVEAISDELMLRFDVSATYGYDFAEAVINRIEAMAKELERGEQE